MGGCFDADGIVTVENVGEITMAQLAQMKEEGVKVLTVVNNHVQFSLINYWSDVNEDKWHDFITLTTSDGHKLTLTPQHLIFVTDGTTKPIFASNVQLGQFLWVHDQTSNKMVESMVVEKKVDNLRGFYAPVTKTGSIIVSGVAASCFSGVENEKSLPRLTDVCLESATKVQ